MSNEIWEDTGRVCLNMEEALADDPRQGEKLWDLLYLGGSTGENVIRCHRDIYINL